MMSKISPKVYNLVACAWALGGIVALLAYLDNRKTAKVKKELMALEKQIKEHQLSHEKLKTKIQNSKPINS